MRTFKLANILNIPSVIRARPIFPELTRILEYTNRTDLSRTRPNDYRMLRDATYVNF